MKAMYKFNRTEENKDYYDVAVFDGYDNIEFPIIIDDHCKENNLILMDKDSNSIIENSKFDINEVMVAILEGLSNDGILKSAELTEDYQNDLDSWADMNRNQRRKFVRDYEKRTGKKWMGDTDQTNDSILNSEITITRVSK